MVAARPRYLVITELFLPTKGGTAVWFAEVYARLGDKGTHIVTAAVPGAEQIDATHPNCVHRVPLRRYSWLKPESVLMYTKLLVSGLWLALRCEFDAVHAGRVLPEGLVAWAIGRLIRKPVVIYAHGEELTTWGRGAKYRTMLFVFRRADRVIANSDYTCGELTRIGVDQARLTVIYPGVDTARFRPGLPSEDLRTGLGLGSGQKLILSVGRLQRRKGFDVLTQAVAQLVRHGLDVHYALVGIGEDRAYLQELASRLGVANRVHQLGHVRPEDLPRWYNACDVFAMPNRDIDGDTEGFGMVFVEAAACGKASIAGIAGGTGAAVVDGVTGLRVDGASVLEVSQAVSSLLCGGDLARRLGGAGYLRVLSEFSWERVAAQTLLTMEKS